LADAVVFVVGYNHDDEGEYISNPDEEVDALGDGEASFGEGGDRKTSLGLHEDEAELIKAVGPQNRNSVAVLIGGNMIMIEEWKKDVSAILMAYYPGMEGGTAIAKTLFGDVNPSGKLPFVLPAKESDLPQTDWDAETITYGYYHGYSKLDKEGVNPSLPYGFGQSYTSFKLSGASFGVENEHIAASCEVENTGDFEGAEVVQLYVGYRNSKIDRPVKVLRGFERVELKPGEKQKVTITCPIEKVKWFNPETNKWELEEMDYEVYIGTSNDNKDLVEGKINLTNLVSK
jgi:beta-glucosidase